MIISSLYRVSGWLKTRVIALQREQEFLLLSKLEHFNCIALMKISLRYVVFDVAVSYMHTYLYKKI